MDALIFRSSSRKSFTNTLCQVQHILLFAKTRGRFWGDSVINEVAKFAAWFNV